MKNILLFTIAFMLNFTLKAQEEITHYNVNEFNGVWRNQVDTSVFYLFKKGKYLSFYIDKNSRLNLIDYGIYGFYSGELNNKIYKINGIRKKGNSTDSLAIISSDNFIVGYEFEAGDRSLNLYNQNPFFYERIYLLPKIFLDQLYLITRQKNINLDDFLYDIEVVSKSKVSIYTKSKLKGKMYLIKGDQIKILKQDGDWLYFRYIDKRTIEGWIKANDLD